MGRWQGSKCTPGSHLPNMILYIASNVFFVLKAESFSDVLLNRCSEKFNKFHRKASALKRDTKFLRTPFFTEHLQWLLMFLYVLHKDCRSNLPEFFFKKKKNGSEKHLNRTLVPGSLFFINLNALKYVP